MADYGLLTEVVVVPRVANLTADASVSDTELVVDDAGDFNTSSVEDPDGGGGSLLLNGAELVYTDITWGDTEDDSDTILLDAPLASGADEGDSVQVLVGGLGAEDWYAVVNMGEGDSVMVPLTFAQRAQWPLGTYDPAVVVQVSDDHERLEDAPGRPASAASRVAFWNTDDLELTGSGDAVLILAHTPLPGSLHVRWNGLSLRPEDWTLTGRTLTVDDAEAVFAADDVVSTAYAYDPGASALVSDPVVETLIPFTTSGWRYLQVTLADTTDYSSPAFDDSGWSSGSTMFGNGVGSGSGAATNWDEDTSLWLRRTFPRSQDVTITVPVEDGCDVYVNGTLVGSSGIAGVGSHHISPPFEVEVDAELTSAGVNTLAIRANDEAGGSSDETSVDVEVTGAVLG